MDRDYEGNETQALALMQGLVLVIPPKKNRKTPWIYDVETYKRRNEIGRFFIVSSVFASFLLSTTSLILFIFPFLLWL